MNYNDIYDILLKKSWVDQRTVGIQHTKWIDQTKIYKSLEL
jgi:hypothetical protein